MTMSSRCIQSYVSCFLDLRATGNWNALVIHKGIFNGSVCGFCEEKHPCYKRQGYSVSIPLYTFGHLYASCSFVISCHLSLPPTSQVVTEDSHNS